MMVKSRGVDHKMTVREKGDLDLNDPALHFLRDDEFILDEDACKRIIEADKEAENRKPLHLKDPNTIIFDDLNDDEKQKFIDGFRKAWGLKK